MFILFSFLQGFIILEMLLPYEIQNDSFYIEGIFMFKLGKLYTKSSTKHTTF